MSLTRFIQREDVRDRLNRVLPKYARTLDVPLIVPPRGANAGLVGTAFDYACRFEIQRRNRSARGGEWVAEEAIRLLPFLARVSFGGKRSGARLAADMEREARARITGARKFLRRYTALKSPSDAHRRTLAAHAVCLARLDVIYRAGLLAGALDAPSVAEVTEVAELVAAMPRDLGKRGRVSLNPTFGPFSELVGGADADLIAGRTLIDIKTTKHGKVEKAMVRQLVGYLILARAAGRARRRLSRLDKVAIYFSRHACLWELAVDDVIAHDAWAATESWFLSTAKASGRSLVRRIGADDDALDHGHRHPLPGGGSVYSVDGMPEDVGDVDAWNALAFAGL